MAAHRAALFRSSFVRNVRCVRGFCTKLGVIRWRCLHDGRNGRFRRVLGAESAGGPLTGGRMRKGGARFCGVGSTGRAVGNGEQGGRGLGRGWIFARSVRSLNVSGAEPRGCRSAGWRPSYGLRILSPPKPKTAGVPRGASQSPPQGAGRRSRGGLRPCFRAWEIAPMRSIQTTVGHGAEGNHAIQNCLSLRFIVPV